MNIFKVIEQADRADEPTAYKSNKGVLIVALLIIAGGNLTFANAQTGQYMTQSVFFSRYRHDQFEQLDEVPEIAGDDEQDADDDEQEFPDIEDALEWAGDIDNVSDEEVHEYLLEVVGEDNRKRNRDTMIEKVKAFVEAQQS